MKNKRPILVTMAGLLLSIVPCSHTNAGPAKNLLLGTAALMGAYTLASWLSEPSDQDHIRNAQAVNTNTTLSYASLLNTIESLYAINIIECPADQKQQTIDRVSEDNLHIIAKNFFGVGRQTIHSYLNQLNDSIGLIEKQIQTLNKRMHYLTKNNKSADDVYHTMVQTNEQLNRSGTQLRFIRDYLKTHTSYFYLYEFEHVLRNRYARELNLNTVYPTDRYRLQEELRISVMLRAHHQEHPGYLYQEYVRTLNNDIETLFTRITRLAFAYHDRIDECRSLATALTAIKNSIIADPEYSRTISDYQAYLQQEARLAAERARLAAEREHLRMEHERACLERERARIERENMRRLEEQNRILREQNRIKEQELRERELYEAQRERTEIVVVTCTNTTEPSAPPAYEEVIDDSGCYY